MLVAGIDGGATRTRAVVADDHGRVLGSGQAGPTNLGSVAQSQIKVNLEEALNKAIKSLPGQKLDFVFLGIAGVTTVADRQVVKDAMELIEEPGVAKVAVDHDIRTALAGGLGGDEGIAVVSGTGSSCYGRRLDGRSWQAGGWAHLVDDAGSAYDIAVKGLAAAARGADGRGLKTRLTEILFDAIGISELPEIISRIHNGGSHGGKAMGKQEIAALAPLVAEAADNGDDVAERIIDDAAGELALMVKTVAEKLDWQESEVKVITAGSVANCDTMAPKLRGQIHRAVDGARIVEPLLPPVLGAVLLALMHVDVETGQELVHRLGENCKKREGIKPPLKDIRTDDAKESEGSQQKTRS